MPAGLPLCESVVIFAIFISSCLTITARQDLSLCSNYVNNVNDTSFSLYHDLLYIYMYIKVDLLVLPLIQNNMRKDIFVRPIIARTSSVISLHTKGSESWKTVFSYEFKCVKFSFDKVSFVERC